MSDPSEAAFGAEIAKYLWQAGIVGAGWYAVHKLSIRRERSKARRELVVRSADYLDSFVDQVHRDAREYHLAGRGIGLELRLKMALQDLAARTVALSSLCDGQTQLAQCRSAVAALRRAITGTHFEDEHLHALGESDPQILSIAEAVMRTKRAFTELRHSQYPPA